jgi:lysophospholipase L1-like esterase
MLDCLILGDSIAKGISDVRHECVAYVRSGINSRDWNNTYGKNVKPAKNTIISLGSNDFSTLNTEVELVALRSRIQEGRVFWIIPAIKPQKQHLVREVARSFGDTVVTIPELSQDQVHPTYRGYRQLGELTK